MFLLCVWLVSNFYSINAQIKVKTSEGVVLGGFNTQAEYYTFYGIPYASSPAGNRFKAPLPPIQYDLFIANDTSKLCAQLSSDGAIGDEDCLILNIFTNNVTTSKPVLVWLEGEDFSYATNTALYSYKSLVRAGIVVVTVNYRLSIFGFLCLEVKEAPGNAGLKDVIAALNWINKNIAAFGGDPSNVILLGHGTGAVIVDLITMSQQTKKLVHKAIALSGSALSPCSIAISPLEHAQHVARILNFNNASVMNRQTLAETLKKVDKEHLLQATKNFIFFNKTLLFAPCIDTFQMDSVLKDIPINLLRSGNYNDIPYIYGFVTHEETPSAKQADNETLKKLNDSFEEFIPADIDTGDKTTKNNILQLILNKYFGKKNITSATLSNFLEYESDTLKTIPMIRGVKERSKTSKSDVRLLQLESTKEILYDAPKRDGNSLFAKYILYTESVKDHDLSQILTNRIVGFAKSGIPVKERHLTNPYGQITWLPFKNESYYLVIEEHENGSDEYNTKNPRAEHTAFWESIYNKYSRHYTTSSQLALPSASAISQNLWYASILSVIISFMINR